MAQQVNSKLSTHIKLSSGRAYSSIFIKAHENKPYILFLHGFPSSSYDWRRQIGFFSDAGYGIIAPDLLGYGDTDKPPHPEAYTLKSMSDDIAGLLDYYQIERVLGVGHDWGSILLSRMANYHPERISMYMFLNVGYMPPLGQFDVDDINNLTETTLGYPMFGYWHFFNAPDAADIMTENPETSRALIYPANPKILLEHLCPKGAAISFYTKQLTGPLPTWLSEDEATTHSSIFSTENGGYRGGLNWYKAQMANLNAADDDTVPSERRQIDKPTLLVVCTKDYVANLTMQTEQTRAFANQMEVETLDCGHWAQLEKADETNAMLKQFIEKHI